MTEQDMRSMALLHAVNSANTSDSKPILAAAEAYLGFLQAGNGHSPTATDFEVTVHHAWFMARDAEEIVCLVAGWLSDRPDQRREVAYHILKEWLAESSNG